jgi:hypothetical protein
MRRLSLAIASFALFVLLATPALVAAQEDPASLLNELMVAANAHDADAQLALFAPDAVVETPGEGPDDVVTYTGTDEIRGWIEEDMGGDGADDVVTLGEITVDGDTASAPFQLMTNDPMLVENGLDPVLGTVEITAAAGKVARFTITGDPEWMAKAMAAMEAMEAQAAETPTAAGPGEAETTGDTDDGAMEGGAGPGKLPASGSDTTNWMLVSLLGILGLGGLGAGVWMRNRAS